MPQENIPVYVSYLWNQGEEDDAGRVQYRILLAKGRWQFGQFTAEYSDGGDFTVLARAI